MAAKTKKKTTKTTTRRVPAPSAAELARAVELMQAAQAAEERRRKQAWISEGVIGKSWRFLTRPPRDGIRDLYRHVLTPWYWAVPAGAAIAIQEAVVTTNLEAGAASLGVVAAGAGVTANLAPSYLRTKRAKERHRHASAWAEHDPGHTRVVANLAAAGAVAAHVVGMSVGWDPDTALAVATAGAGVTTAASARYWQWHRRHTVVLNRRGRKALADAAKAATPGTDPTELVRRLRERWPRFVAAPAKALPGSKLTDIEQTSYGATATLHLAAGSQEQSTVTAALGRIASGLKLSPSALAVEGIDADDGQEPDSSVLRLRVVSQAISDRPAALDDGPRIVRRGKKTYARLGRYIDDQGEAEWLLYDGESMWGGFFAGKTGAGKTTLIEALVMAAFETGNTFVIYAKPRKGPSPRIAKHAHWVVEADALSRSAMIDGVVRMMEVRGLINELNDTSNFTPSPEFPGVMVVADEFHEFSAQVEAAGKGRLNRLAREIRAVGGCLVGASQGFGLEGFQQDDVLRSNMTANAVSMKLSATQAGIFKREMAMPVNPGTLPDPAKGGRNRGLAYSLLGRPIPFRGAWAPEEETDRLMAAARANAVEKLDPESEAALDEGSKGAFSQRHSQQAKRKEEVLRKLTQMRQSMGITAPLSGAEEAPAASVSVAPKMTETPAPGSTDDQRLAARAGLPVPPALPERVVLDMQAARKAKESEAKKRTSGPRRAPAIEGVIEVLQAKGPTTTTAIRAALSGRNGCGKTAVDTALATLEAEGAIVKADSSRKAPWKLT